MDAPQRSLPSFATILFSYRQRPPPHPCINLSRQSIANPFLVVLPSSNDTTMAQYSIFSLLKSFKVIKRVST